MSDRSREPEETEERGPEREVRYSDGYLHTEDNIRKAEIRRKRRRSQIIREVLIIVLFLAVTALIVILVRKCVGDDKKETTPGKETPVAEQTTPSKEVTPPSGSEATPAVTDPTVPPTDPPTAPPVTEPTTTGPTEEPGMIYNGVQLPPYRPLQTGTSVAVQSGITMPSWIVQDLIPVDGAHRPGLAINQIKHVVIHYVGNTLSSAKDNRDYFATPPDSPVYDGRQVSSHFIIGLYGEIIQCVPLNEVAYAQGVAADSGRPNHNWDAISIENSHYNDAGEFTSMTEESLVKLTAWLLESYGLPATTETILRHYDCSGKACPKHWADDPTKYNDFVNKVAYYMALHPNISAEFP